MPSAVDRVLAASGAGPTAVAVAALFLACAVVFTATVLAPPRWAVPAAVLAAAAAVGWQPTTADAVVTALSLAVAVLAATLVRRLRGDRAQQGVLIERMRASREAERQSAALAERTHIARELHDVLAHSLSALAVSLERTRVQAQVTGADPAVVGQLAAAHDVAGRGLVEARRAVGALRGDVVLSPTSLLDLVATFTAATGVRCRTQIAPAPADLPVAVHLTMFRALQEALANSTRYAPLAEVAVDVDYSPARAGLVVQDGTGPSTGPLPGRSAVGQPPGAGLGLVGLRERVELLGGSCSAGPHGAGWRVHVELPR